MAFFHFFFPHGKIDMVIVIFRANEKFQYNIVRYYLSTRLYALTVVGIEYFSLTVFYFIYFRLPRYLKSIC